MRQTTEPPRTRAGLRLILCNLFNYRPHGMHRYRRGDEVVVCTGRGKDR